jgi:predicted lipid-binding transport protein (Tim44 family)
MKACALVGVGALLLGACGGGGNTVSAQQYVRTACTSLSAWITGIQQRSQDLQAKNPSSAEEGKKLFTDFFDGIIADTGKLEDQLKAAGTPDVENGDKIASAVVAALDKVRSLLEQSRSRVESLPTDNPQDFAKAVQEAGQSVQNAFQQANIGNDLQSPELSSAAAKEPACQSLGT